MVDKPVRENVLDIEEVKTRLDGGVERFRCRRLLFTEEEMAVSYLLERDRDLHGILLPKGTQTLAYFWDSRRHQDRPFNVYHFISGAGNQAKPSRGFPAKDFPGRDFPDRERSQTLAYYFNISDQCRLEPDRVCWRDLVVDIVGRPGSPPLVVDEELLPADLPAPLRTYINDAKQIVLRHYDALIADIEQRSAMLV